MLTIDKINMMAGSYDRIVEQNKSLQKELLELKTSERELKKQLTAERQRNSRVMITLHKYEDKLIKAGLLNSTLAHRQRKNRERRGE